MVVPADHQVAIGHEGAQPGPAVRRAPDLKAGDLLNAVYAQRHVQLLGYHVVRRHRVGVGRRAQQLARVGLEVIALVDSDHGRPAAGVHACGHGEGEGRAPARLQANRRHAGQCCDHVGPGTGGIHHGAGGDGLATGQPHAPAVIQALQPRHLGIAADGAAALAQAAQIALVQRVHVDVGGAGLAHAGGHGLGAQAGQLGQQLIARQAAHAGVERQDLGIGRVQQIELIRPRKIDHAARREDGRAAELGRRRIVEGAAGARQRPDVGRAIGGRVQRGRAPRGVVAGLGFALQQQHAALPGQFPAHGGAGNARADDDEVVVVHGFRVQ